jgi:hypothetical protein
VLADLTESRAAGVYAALGEIERLAVLIPGAPSLADRMALADELSRRHARYRELLLRAEGTGDPRPGMAEAAPAIDEARRRVESANWWEGLAAVTLCAPLTDELFGALTGEPEEADPAGTEAAADTGATDSTEVDDSSTDVTPPTPKLQAAEQLRDAIEGSPELAARIALWARRLVGEAIVLAREFGGERYPGLANQLAASHARRLTELGLAD